MESKLPQAGNRLGSGRLMNAEKQDIIFLMSNSHTKFILLVLYDSELKYTNINKNKHSKKQIVYSPWRKGN